MAERKLNSLIYMRYDCATVVAVLLHAFPSHGRGRRFKPCITHQSLMQPQKHFGIGRKCFFVLGEWLCVWCVIGAPMADRGRVHVRGDAHHVFSITPNAVQGIGLGWTIYDAS